MKLKLLDLIIWFGNWSVRGGEHGPPGTPLVAMPLFLCKSYLDTSLHICIDIWPYNSITYPYTLLVTLNNVSNYFSLSLILTLPHTLLFLLTKEPQNYNAHLKEPFDPKDPQKRYTTATCSHNLRLSTEKAA